jgi:hypothetical protein
MHDAENDRADAEGHEHGDKRQENDIDVSEVRSWDARLRTPKKLARTRRTNSMALRLKVWGRFGVAPIELPSSSDRS